MSTNGIRVFIPDPSHGKGYTDGPSAQFRQQLEAEYGENFQSTSIGTGAALASYFVELACDPYRVAAMAATVFFTGKAIREGFEAWGWMYAQLSKFFHHEPTFDREGAAILVYKAVADKMAGIPKTYQLKGFTIQHRLAFPDPFNLPDPGPLTTIEPAPQRVERATVYVFQVAADGRDFRVEVDGHNIKFLQE